jgi:hypothetical protein
MQFGFLLFTQRLCVLPRTQLDSVCFFMLRLLQITLAHCYASVGLYTNSTVPMLQPWDCKFLPSAFFRKYSFEIVTILISRLKLKFQLGPIVLLRYLLFLSSNYFTFNLNDTQNDTFNPERAQIDRSLGPESTRAPGATSTTSGYSLSLPTSAT